VNVLCPYGKGDKEDLWDLTWMGKEKEMSEKQISLIAYRESYKMMFRSIKKQLQDTELGTGSGTNRHTYTYVRYGRVQSYKEKVKGG
jgi:hypothetical protein